MPKPFSAKQKKAQLKEKRERKRVQSETNEPDEPQARERPPTQRLESVFNKQPAHIIEEMKQKSRLAIHQLPEEALEVGLDDIYPPEKQIDFPKRPKWSFSDTKQMLEAREEQYFKSWLQNVYSRFDIAELSFFEHSLEVWAEFWRVVEISDILLFVVDSRHPILHFPPTLYKYVVESLNKKLVLVFNKIDLIPDDVLEAWCSYFKTLFPGLLTASFSCYPRDGFLVNRASKGPLKRYKRYHRAVGALELVQACRDVKLIKEGVHVDWEAIITRMKDEIKQREDLDAERLRRKENADEFLGRSRRRQRFESEHEQVSSDDDESESDEEPDEDFGAQLTEEEEANVSSDVVTIGLVGHPNVGKSSLINGILGKVAVSVSKTPGHTKHRQTIFLDKKLRLCDCPGLVFPSCLIRPLQILSGMYKIAQVQEPYSSISYLSERVPIQTILNLNPPEDDPEAEGTDQSTFPWSGWTICEAFALQRGFLTTRAARPDVYRAANMILRMANDGRILLYFRPPGFSAGKWSASTNPASSKAYAVASRKNQRSTSRPKSQPTAEIDDYTTKKNNIFDLLAETE